MNLHNQKWDIKIINVSLQGVQVVKHFLIDLIKNIVKAHYMHSYSSLMI
jgi:hypothetical protein